MPPPPGIVERFLAHACPDHHVRGGTDHLRARHTALRLLERYPDLTNANVYTAAVCGDVAAVTRALAGDPAWATRPDGQASAAQSGGGGEGDLVTRDWGPKGWEPLLYLCFTRLPLPAVDEQAVTIARLLLDRGANPNAYFMAGSSRYTPLVGAIGEGEEGRPAHSRRNELVALLLERGADPYDGQVGYNIHFNGKVLWFLEAIYGHSVRQGLAQDWADPEWTMLHQGGYGSGARWYLDAAVAHNDVELADWCLRHGANPNAAPGPRRRNRQGTLHQEAVARGHLELADILARHGAARSPDPPGPLPTLLSACIRGDEPSVRGEIARHPELLLAAEPLVAATRHNRRDAARALLDLGASPNVETAAGERPLHIAAYHDSAEVAELLIARGAEVDAIGRQFDNTPLGGAMHLQSRRMIDLLCRFSRSAWEVGYAGNVDRLRELLTEKPERARASEDGETLLMWLPPDDEAVALEVAALLLRYGADPAVRDRHGMTAADRAERSAMFKVAALLR